MNNSPSVTQAQAVQIGMPVYDKTGRRLGWVSRIRLTDQQPVEKGHKKVATSPINDQEWLNLIAEVVEPDDSRAMALAKEFWDEGFIKINGTEVRGLYQYILPTQIEKVDDQGVYLNISR